jgi:hypothetical protein
MEELEIGWTLGYFTHDAGQSIKTNFLIIFISNANSANIFDMKLTMLPHLAHATCKY